MRDKFSEVETKQKGRLSRRDIFARVMSYVFSLPSSVHLLVSLLQCCLYHCPRPRQWTVMNWSYPITVLINKGLHRIIDCDCMAESERAERRRSWLLTGTPLKSGSNKFDLNDHCLNRAVHQFIHQKWLLPSFSYIWASCRFSFIFLKNFKFYVGMWTTGTYSPGRFLGCRLLCCTVRVLTNFTLRTLRQLLHLLCLCIATRKALTNWWI